MFLSESRIICYMPAYNASSSLESVVRRIPDEAWAILDLLLIIDDGSTDSTAEAARSLSRRYQAIRLVSHLVNSGYGAAQKTAFDWVLKNGGDIAVMLHSDGQYPPDKLVPMLEPFRDGVDVVGGSRILYGDMRKGGMSRTRHYGTIWLNALENLVFRQSLTSYHSGYKAYTRTALERIPYGKYSNTFNFDSEMLAGAIRAGLKIGEVPIPTIHGKGYSSLKPVPYGFSVLHTLLRYIFRKI